MGFFDQFSSHNDTLNGFENPTEEHKGHLSHEVIAGAAGFSAFKAYEDKQKREGKDVKHALAKEVLAGFASAEAEKLFETKGLNWIDKEKAKHDAKVNAEKLYDEYQ